VEVGEREKGRRTGKEDVLPVRERVRKDVRRARHGEQMSVDYAAPWLLPVRAERHSGVRAIRVLGDERRELREGAEAELGVALPRASEA
jgi:hypothetical protein